jgi:hypothetical protein
LGRLVVPPNITLVPLPPKCREINPMENIWQFKRKKLCSAQVRKIPALGTGFALLAFAANGS